MSIEDMINDKYSQLNSTDKLLVSYTLKNKKKIPHMKVREVAEECHISKSTFLRYVKKLGLSGFNELKYVLKSDQQKIEVKDSFKEDLIEEIQLFTNQLPQLDMTSICKAIYNSKRLFVYGTGTEQKLCANEIKRYFWRVNKHINIIDDEMDLVSLIPLLNEDDFIIFVSISGNTPSLVPYIKQIEVKEIPTLSITQMKNNELAQRTTFQLYPFTNSRSSNFPLEITTFSTFFIIVEVLFRSYLDYINYK